MATNGQKIIVCDGYGNLFNFNVNTCALNLINDCGKNKYGTAYSLALQKDTLYTLTSKGNVYSQVLNKPNSCKLITTTYYTGNAMTVDEDGMLYICSGQTLIRINSHTGQIDRLGNIPFWSAGDLFFYKKRLYLAAQEGIVLVNIVQPAKSTLHIRSSINFFGIINVPDGCNNNKVYGVASSLYEINMENRTVGKRICTPSIEIFDVASITENGYTEGVNIDTLLLKNICLPAEDNTGSIQIKAGTATPGATLQYVLNNSSQNSSGIFSNLSPGTYSIKVTSSKGCFKDTTAILKKGTQPAVVITPTPDTCLRSVGKVLVNSTSVNLPITYSLNNGTPQTSQTFTHLSAKQYKLRATTNLGCYKDTPFEIVSYKPPTPLQSAISKPEICDLGSIILDYDSRVMAIKLDQDYVAKNSILPDLPSKVYKLSLETNNCTYDTLIDVKKELPEYPNIKIAIDTPTCFNKNDGAMQFSIEGNYAPFSLYTNDTLSSNGEFTKLSNGSYSFTIKDQAGCTWDTSVTIKYTPVKPATLINKSDAECWTSAKGWSSLSITGKNQPYTFSYADNDTQLISGDTVKNLYSGSYKFYVTDKNGCVVDSVQTTINKIDQPLKVGHISLKPSLCDNATGAAIFEMNENAGQVYFSMNNGPFENKLAFEKLSNGTYKFAMRDNNGCLADTAISIELQKPPTPAKNIQITPVICSQKGSIFIELLPGQIASDFQLNGDTPQSSPLFSEINEGAYHISFIHKGCNFDTTVTLKRITPAKPDIAIATKDVDCYNRNNGAILVNATNGASPYTFSYNNSAFITDKKISNLAPGTYAVSVKDNAGCLWDTSTFIKPFTIKKPFINQIVKSPVCFVDERAGLQVSINGTESPYTYKINNITHASGNEIKLPAGFYHVYINNNTGCTLDSFKVDLSYSRTGTLPCDTIMVPSAFTPNNDQKNDVLRPYNHYTNFTDYTFSVYNRLGQLLFQSKSIDKGWDGYFKGHLQPQETYVWLLIYKSTSGKRVTLKGTAVLLR